MHNNIYDVIYSQYFRQNVSTDILTFFGVMSLLQEYKMYQFG